MVRAKPSTRRAWSQATHPVDGSKPLAARPPGTLPFDVHQFLDSSAVARRIVECRRGDVVFRQGDRCDSVLYVKEGGVKISVLSPTGKQAVLAMLGPGNFFGEEGLAGRPVRVGSARAIARSTIMIVEQHEMVRLLREEHAISDRLMAYLLARTIRVEEELVDQFFNSTERRLARKLLLLARYGHPDSPVRAVPEFSQETLAEMVGTTRSRRTEGTPGSDWFETRSPITALDRHHGTGRHARRRHSHWPLGARRETVRLRQERALERVHQ